MSGVRKERKKAEEKKWEWKKIQSKRREKLVYLVAEDDSP